MLPLSLIIPELATAIAIINFSLIVINFRHKPWKYKFWLYIGTGMWISWAGFAVLFRIAPDYESSRIILVFSFSSSYLALYGLYRFHILLTRRDHGSNLMHYVLLIITGINICTSYNQNFYIPVLNADGYWVDEFTQLFFLMHFLYTILIGSYILKALRELNSFALFYQSDRKYNLSLLILGGLILGILGFLVVFRSLQATQEGGAPFLLISMIITSYFGIIYGIYPLSKVLVPQKIWAFLIINRAGLPVYEKSFSEELIGENILLSSAIYASMLLFSEKLDGQLLEEVELKDRIVLMKRSSGFVYTIIAEYNSPQLEMGLDELIYSISSDTRVTFRTMEYIQVKEEYINNHVNNILGSTSFA